MDRLKDLNIGYSPPRSHRSVRGVIRKKQNVLPFVVASFNAQSVKGNDISVVLLECRYQVTEVDSSNPSMNMLYSKALYPHCFSRLNCEMSTRWGQTCEGCSVL